MLQYVAEYIQVSYVICLHIYHKTSRNNNNC